jgi:ABC-type bacteriocin/lantibiotic exporter with double-glycine peptidase domain
VLARLFFRNPEILLMDEATSALDLMTSRKIVTEFEGFFRNKTVLVITHKPEDFEHLLDEKITSLN